MSFIYKVCEMLCKEIVAGVGWDGLVLKLAEGLPRTCISISMYFHLFCGEFQSLS